MKKANRTRRGVKRSKDNKLRTRYDEDPEIRNKIDEILDLLYKIICKASTGIDSKDSITIKQLCRGLNKFGFKISKNQLLSNMSALNEVKDDYKLELIHTKDNKNITNTRWPPINHVNQLSELNLSSINKETLKKIFLNVDLKLSLTNTIY